MTIKILSADFFLNVSGIQFKVSVNYLPNDGHYLLSTWVSEESYKKGHSKIDMKHFTTVPVINRYKMAMAKYFMGPIDEDLAYGEVTEFLNTKKYHL